MSPVHEDSQSGHRSDFVTSSEVGATWEIPPDLGKLGMVFQAVEDFGERAGWPMEFVLQAQLVLEEMMLNVITHSGATDPVVMRMASRHNEAEIEIIDRGMPFDPTEVPSSPPGDSPSLEDMAIGGLGIHLVRSMVQDMSYRRTDDANHLTLVLPLSDA